MKAQSPKTDLSGLLSFQDIPMSLPIQCTEDAWTEGGEQPAASPQVHPKAPQGSAHPLAPPNAAHTLPGASGWYPACSDLGAGRATLPGAFGSSQVGRKEKMLVDTWLEDCRRTPTTNSPEEGARACCSPQEFVTPSSEAEHSFLTILDLYEAPEALGREDAPSDSTLSAAEKVPVEIRGPLKVNMKGSEVSVCSSWCKGTCPSHHHPLLHPSCKVGSCGCGYALKLISSGVRSMKTPFQHLVCFGRTPVTLPS